MPLTNDDIFDYILQFEGGYTNNSNDAGGPTNFGITAADLGRFLGLQGPATADQVRAMTRAQALDIYRSDYLTGPRFDQIADDSLRFVVIDSGVLFGTGRAGRWLPQALQVTADGIIGEQTLAALRACPDPAKLARAVLALRFCAVGDIVAGNPSQIVFLRGWLNRSATLLERL
jgi:lysozyme family protein